MTHAMLWKPRLKALPSQLSPLEDSTLAISQEEGASIHLSRAVISACHETNYSQQRMVEAIRHLSNLGLVRWHYFEKGKKRISKFLPIRRNIKHPSFHITPAGQHFLDVTPAP